MRADISALLFSSHCYPLVLLAYIWFILTNFVWDHVMITFSFFFHLFLLPVLTSFPPFILKSHPSFSSTSSIPPSYVRPRSSFHPRSLPFCPCPEGDWAGPSRFSAGAFAMCPSTGPGVDPHSVPVCRAGGLWYGLSGAEEVHPQGPGSQVGDRERFKVDLKFWEVSAAI